jgi:integrase
MTEVPYAERLRDHDAVVGAYFRTFEKRAYTEASLQRTDGFLKSFFEGVLVQDAAHPTGERHLLIWDLLLPIEGPETIDLLATSLNQYDYSHSTRMKYLGFVRVLCDFVLTKPYIPGRVPVLIVAKYGHYEHPFSKFDYPVHAVEDIRVDPALTEEDLRMFLDFVRVYYIAQNQKKLTAQRNYAMIVLAVTSGMRADELVNLDLDDLRYLENRVWIRFGKGYKGSGKRQRLTLFTKFAQATIHQYEALIRPQLVKPSTTNRALFLSEAGRRINYDSMRLALVEIAERARAFGLTLPTPFGWHDLRRSFATEYLARRPDRLLVLSGYMGHTGLGTLYRYIRPSRSAFKKSTEGLIARTIPPEDDPPKV